MEKKNTILSLILVGVIVISACILIVVLGITANEYNYVQLEVNPRAEFLCDKKFKVVSAMALNDDGKVILSGLDYKGRDISKVTTDFLTLSAKAGYLDVDGVNNAVNITVIDGLTQALDSHVTKAVYKFLNENEIMGGVIENYEDRKMFDGKKENNLCCANKYKLLLTMDNENYNEDFDTLKSLSEVKLIDKVYAYHNSQNLDYTSYKSTLDSMIENNSTKYNTHMQSITNKSRSEFATLFDKYQHSSLKKYQEDFSKQYSIWQENNTL